MNSIRASSQLPPRLWCKVCCHVCESVDTISYQPYINDRQSTQRERISLSAIHSSLYRDQPCPDSFFSPSIESHKADERSRGGQTKKSHDSSNVLLDATTIRRITNYSATIFESVLRRYRIKSFWIFFATLRNTTRALIDCANAYSTLPAGIDPGIDATKNET